MRHRFASGPDRITGWVRFLATWHYSGLSPKAPGTTGTLAALPAGVALLWFGGSTALLIGILALSALGLYVSHRYALESGAKDPGEVVIDEAAGMWIALLPAGLIWWQILSAVVLFRLFDILKPGPVGWADRRLSGGLGIMADDLMAGALAALVLATGLTIWESAA